MIVKLEHTSASNILLFAKSFKEWCNRYVHKEPFIPTIYTLSGNIIHKVLETFLSSDFESETLREHFTDKFNPLIDNYILKYKKELDVLSNDDLNASKIKEVCFNYLKNLLSQLELKTSTKTYKEIWDENKPNFVELELKDTKYKLVGHIDCGFISKDKNATKSKTFTIMDFKTSRKDLFTNRTDYYIQLIIYAYLCKQNKMNVDWVAIDFIRTNEKHFYRVTDEGMKKVEQLLKDYWKQIDKLNNCNKIEKFKKDFTLLRYI